MEQSTDVFRTRTGDNISSEDGGGNTRYNKETGEIDINFKQSGDFSEQQKLAHELKHGFQFLNGQLGFKLDGTADGILNDYQDEYEGYQRQNRFAGFGGKGYLSDEKIHTIIGKQYGYNFRRTNKSLRILSKDELNQMIKINRGYMEHTGKPHFIYKGYESDL